MASARRLFGTVLLALGSLACQPDASQDDPELGGAGGARNGGPAAASARGAEGGTEAAGGGRCEPALDRTGAAAISELCRGINLGNALDAPSEGDWGVVLTGAHFGMAREAGFDHVRLPVRFSAHALEEAPYAIDEAFFRRVDWALAQAFDSGLAVVLDLHHYLELMQDPDGHRERFVGLWQQIAERYREQPPALKFELLNEPQLELGEQWNALAVAALSVVRAVDPERPVIIDSAHYAAARRLAALELSGEDRNLVVSFHMYEPVLFTHQGAEWAGPEYGTLGVEYPGPPLEPLVPGGLAAEVDWVKSWFDDYNRLPTGQNPSGPTVIDTTYRYVREYLENTNRQVYLGEFGVVSAADPESRARWVRAVRVAAEQHGIPWAYWDDGGAFQAMDPSTGEWVESIRHALLQ